MAIKAIIATQFDATGIKKATKEFDKLGKGLRSTLGAVGLGVGLAAITSGLKDAAKAAVSDVKSQALLAQQLKNTVGATDQAIAGSESFIKSLQLQTSIADDQLRPALATLVRATGDLTGAQGLLSLATDVSAGTGLGLETVAKAIGKAVNGQTGALKKLGIVIKEGEDPVQALTAAFGGMAAAAANNDPFQRINVIMGEMQEQIGMALLPTLNELAAWFASPEGQAKIQEFVDAIVRAVDFLVNLVNVIIENIDWLGPLATAIGVATAAMTLFNLAMNTNPIMLMITAVGLLAVALQALQPNINAAANGVPKEINWAASKAGQEAYDKAMRDPKNFEQTSTGPKLKTGAAMVAERARNDAFQAAIDKYKKSLVKADAEVAKPSAKGFSPFAPAKGGAKTKSKAEVALEAATKKLNAFKDALKGMGDFSQLTTISKDMGEFEQSVTETFDGIYKKLAEAPTGTKGVAKLKTFLDAQKALLVKNAQDRDAIIKKRSLAKALIEEVTSSLMGTGNLANLLETQTKQVTTSVTKIVDGFSVTTKRTVDEVVGGKGVVSKLKEVVAKTKAFATQLTDLKKAGLNPDLFKQIVDAGPDVGGQLATEILAGGKDSVTSLNDTFKELQTATEGIAEQTAVVMYNAGVEVAGGLVNGLLAQEAQIVAAAQQLADAFNAAYNAQIKQLEVPTPIAATPKTTTTVKTVTNNITVKAPVSSKATGQQLQSAINKYSVPNAQLSIQTRRLL